MKPKFRTSLRRRLPLVISLCFAGLSLADAAVINTDPATGNALLADSGANTLLANGGTDNFININLGVTITGDAAELDGIRITGLGGGPQYNILNVGNITVGNAFAVNGAGFSAFLENNGLMSNTAGNLVVLGDDSGLQNTEQFLGTAIAFSAGADAIINNTATGEINGATSHAISTGARLTLTNAGLIDGNGTGDGIRTGPNSTITNNGEINGAGSGIFSNDFLNVTNNGSILSDQNGIWTFGNDFTLLNTGLIIGSNNAILTGERANITNTSLLQGIATGVHVGSNSSINNTLTGQIQGSTGPAIQAGSELFLSNAGLIISTNGDGIVTGNQLEIVTSGLVSGQNTGIITQNNSIITNNATGTIRGLTLFGIEAGNNNVYLNRGRIQGLETGISAGNSNIVSNTATGIIEGLTQHGIAAGDELDVRNQGIIRGQAGDGIHLTGDFAVIENSADALITSISGSAIHGGSNHLIQNSGEIIGEIRAIDVADNVTIHNLTPDSLIFATFPAISTGNNLLLTNNGTISSDLDAIFTSNNSTIQNHNLIDAGNGNGITAGAFLTLSNTGDILATQVGVGANENAWISNTANIEGNFVGVIVGDFADIENFSDARIIGINADGIDSANSLVLLNYGEIRGNTTGVRTLSNSNITNDGLINGGDGDGIFAFANLILTNNGLVAGDLNAVTATTGATIANTDLIRGGENGIVVTDGATITNFTAAHIMGLSADAIISGNNLLLDNSGTIGGDLNGVITANNSTILNQTGSEIYSSFVHGLSAGNQLSLTNHGLIRGGEHAVSTGNSAIIRNESGATFLSGALNGLFAGNFLDLENRGNIFGTLSGVVAANDAFIANHATILSQNEHGVSTLAGLTLDNATAATITGGIHGIATEENASIDNRGTIRGLTGAGIIAGDESNIVNYAFDILAGVPIIGEIEGATHGVSIANDSQVVNQGRITGGSSAVNLTGAIGSRAINFGTLIGTGGTAISGSLGDDAIVLIDDGGTHTGARGSLVTGDILSGGGSDSLFFQGGLTGIRTSYQDNFGNAIAAADTTENLVRGNILGFDTIHKMNDGVAFVGDGGVDINDDGVTDALYQITADYINIQEGGLFLNADIGPQTLLRTIIANGAQLGGTGTWNANIINEAGGGFSPGAVPIHLTNPLFQNDLFVAPTTQGPSNPNDSIGAITVSGNVHVKAGSFYQMDVDPFTAANDSLTLTGAGNTLSFDNGSVIRISPTDINHSITNGSYLLAATDSAVLGDLSQIGIGLQFNGNIREVPGSFIGTETGDGLLTGSMTAFSTQTVLGNYFSTLTLGDGGTNLLLEIQHNYAGLPGLTPSQASLGAAFDVLSNNPNVEIQDFIASLDYSNLSYVQGVMDTLTPEAQLGVTASVMNSNYRLHRQIQNHLSNARSHGETTNTHATSGAKGGEIITQTTNNRGNVWGSISHDWQDSQGYNSPSDIDGEVTAFTAGIDFQISEMFVLGGLIDGSAGDYDRSTGGSDVDSLRIAIYGTYGYKLGLYSDFLLGYGSHDLSATRNTAFGSARGSSDAEGLQALWTIGYAMGRESLKHGPFAGFEYQRFDVDGLTESGGFPNVPVTLEDYDVTSFRGLIGYRAEATHGIWKPYASIAYAHEFGDDQIKSTAHLGGFLAGTSFTVYGPEQGSAILLSAGTGIAINHSLSLDVGYRGEISVDDAVDSHGGSIGLNWRF